MKLPIRSKMLVIALSFPFLPSAFADCVSNNQICLAQLPSIAACDLQVYHAYYPNPAPLAVYQTCMNNYTDGMAACQAQFNQCNYGGGGYANPVQIIVVQ